MKIDFLPPDNLPSTVSRMYRLSTLKAKRYALYAGAAGTEFEVIQSRRGAPVWMQGCYGGRRIAAVRFATWDEAVSALPLGVERLRDRLTRRYSGRPAGDALPEIPPAFQRRDGWTQKVRCS